MDPAERPGPVAAYYGTERYVTENERAAEGLNWDVAKDFARDI